MGLAPTTNASTGHRSSVELPGPNGEVRPRTSERTMNRCHSTLSTGNKNSRSLTTIFSDSNKGTRVVKESRGSILILDAFRKSST